MKNKIGVNIIANTVGKVWTILVSILFVPVYIIFLGEESYSIVTFFSVMQSILNIMGVGLQRTLRREFAKHDEDTEISNTRKYKLLRSSEVVYFFICLLIIVICSVGAPYISNQWLNYETLNPNAVATAIGLMGCCIGLQLIANLYAGGVYGLDYQGMANGLQIGWMTLKNAGVILILWLVSSDIVTFYLWNVLADLLYCVVLRGVLIRYLPRKHKAPWKLKDLSNLKSIWRYAGGLLLISVGVAVNTQLDKIIMSKWLPVISCGAYNSASQLGSFTTYIPTIIGTAIFSNITSFLFQKEYNQAKKLFASLNRASVIIVSALSAYISMFSYELILVWTGSSAYAEIMRYAAPMVIIGYTLNAFQQIPYDYLLAAGNTKINQMQLLFCIPYVLTVTMYLTKSFGVNGAAFAWMLQLLICTTAYLIMFHKVCFGKGAIKWMLKEVYLIYLVALISAVVLKGVLNWAGLSPLVTLVIAVLAGGVCLIALLFIFGRNDVRKLLVKVKNKASKSNG